MNLMDEYKEFCDIREKSNKKLNCDLCSKSFIYPTTLLPLINYMKINTLKYFTSNTLEGIGLRSYIDRISNKDSNYLEKSFIPFTELAKNKNTGNLQIQEIYKRLENGKDLGGQNTFKYMISEMIDNIYQHSKFNHAYFLSQKYSKKGFLDVCFYDDGIGIAGSFKNANIQFNLDIDALEMALSGKSTKSDERGYGLSRNLQIIRKEYKGEMLIVSNAGAIHLYDNKIFKYNLSNKYMLFGTLISYRYKFPTKDVNIYDYAE